MAGPGGKASPAGTAQRAVLRIDKWLFQARFFRSRQLAADMVAEGHVRLNGQRMLKPGHAVGAGDVLTFPMGGRVRVVRILDIGQRRGPADEARGLYADLDAPAPPQGPTPLE